MKCDYFEALHIEMHVHTLNLNIAHTSQPVIGEHRQLGPVYTTVEKSTSHEF